ncbi:MAG: M24 family metallopeptidase [Vampirovibrionales bacterium]|nr:M24 family metallopeptidase [Vampirovibrionales bacterium]
MSTRDRLNALRKAMASKGLDAVLILTADSHLSEYVAPPWQHRAWLTGFDGSAGDLLLTQTHAWLTVDSRYHAQAPQQVDEHLIEVVKLGSPHAKTMHQLLQALPLQSRIGADYEQISVRQCTHLQKETRGLQWVSSSGLVASVRQALGQTVAVVPALWTTLPESVAGQSSQAKFEDVRAAMQAKGATLLPLVKLDEIAWLFNLRGGDIPHSPVGFAYAIVSLDKSWLFVHEGTLSEASKAALKILNVQVSPLESFWQVLGDLASTLTPNDCCWLDSANVSQAVSDTLSAHAPNLRQLDSINPVTKLKAVKNQTECDGMQEAVRRASVAIIKMLAWLSRQTPEQLSEADVADYLRQRYFDDPACQDLSFPSIVGAASHSAIVHYSNPSASVPLVASNFLLIDSGGQYLGLDASEASKPFMGTTDATRTVLIGNASTRATLKQKQAYTAVLKSLIAVSSQVFPAGTTGAQLDGITRSPLWQAYLDFGHGSGHGVGAYLSVHEGPNGIHKRAETPLEPGMITSIEPGYYEPGWGGIRLENLAEVVVDEDNPEWLRFKTLTQIPFDPKLIDWSWLSHAEKAWLSTYSQAIEASVLQELSPEEAQWLSEQLLIA